MSDGLPLGARVIRMGGGSPPRSPVFGEGLTHAEYLVKSVHPDAEITQTLRDPDSALGRKNPGSHHVRANRQAGLIPVDVRPIPGMTFEQYVGGFEAKGLTVIEARDEVKNPSSHATGPHWHVALADNDGLPAGARIKKMGASAMPATPTIPEVPNGTDADAIGALIGAPKPDGFSFGSGASASPAPSPQLPRMKSLSGFTEADARRGLATAAPVTAPGLATDLANSFETEVDPAKNARLQSAFDRGASLKELEGLAGHLGIQFEHGNLSGLRDAVNYRNSGGQGARIVPETRKPKPLPAPATIEEANRQNIERMLGNQQLTQGGMLGQLQRDEDVSTKDHLTEILRGVGHSAPERVAREAEWAPIIGGMIALEEGADEIAKGNVATGAAMMALGSLDFAFGGGKGKAARTVLDAAKLDEVAAKAGEGFDRSGFLRSAADEALEAGGRVMLHTDRGSIPISKAGLVDDAGNVWDAERVAGANGRLEIELPNGAPARPSSGAAGEAAPSRVDAPEGAAVPETGPHGPIFRQEANDYPAAVARLREAKTGEVPGVLYNPVVGDIDLVWGDASRFGLSKIIARHPEVVDDLDDIIARLPVKQRPEETGNNRWVLEDESHRAVISPDYNGDPKRWLVTAFLKKDAPGGQTSRRDPLTPDGGSTGAEQGRGISDLPGGGNEGLPAGAKVVRMGDGAASASGGLPARPVRPDEVVPVPGSLPQSADELPTSIVPLESPTVGRAPKRPVGFAEVLKGKLREESAARGVRVRIDAEQAIDAGVPAELIYANPNVADKSKLRLLHPSLFGTRYGAMSAKQQVLRSLDMDNVDPVEWGFDGLAGRRLDPEDIGGLLRRDLEGDPSALQRGGAYDEWAAHQAKSEEAAEFAGRYGDEPPVERRGDPIGSADLDALQPPLSAYEDAPKLVGKIGNLNLERIENPAQVTRLVERIADMVKVDNKALERVGNEELKALATELAVTPAQILKWKQGSIPSPAELYATRVIVHQGRQKIVELAKRARGASDDELARFHNMVAAQSQIERQLAGMAAETGRALQQFNMIAKAGDLSDQAVKAYLKSAGDRETVEEMAEKLIDLAENPAGSGRFLRDATRIRKRDMLNELWINSLLSGPRTHIVNGVSNTFIALWTLPEQALGAAIGRLMGTADRAYVREVGERAVGLIQGAREGLVLAKHAFKTGEPMDAVSKVEATNYHAIPGKLGEVIRLPTRALTASDEFFKAANRRAATNAMAYRRAMQGPGTAEERAARYAELRADPDAALRKFADDEARYLTFQKPLGKGGRYVQGVVNEWPGVKLILPFIRTPINIVKFAGERSPFALIPGTPVWKTLRAGGQARDEALAKITLGSGLSAAAVVYAMDGKLSGGGPTDMNERAALKNSGWQEYSMQVGDKWVSYQRFEPLSMLIGVAADFAEVGKFATEEEGESIAMALATSVAKNITSKTWLSGASDFFDALSDPERHGKSWATRLAASGAVPAIVAHAAGAADPEMREARTLLDKIKQRVPGMSSDIEARRNVWGDPIKKGDSIGPDFLSPIYTSTAESSPLMKEVARLKAPLSMPQRKLTVDGKQVELTPEQYSYYVQLSGKPAKKYFEDMIGTKRWQRMDDEHKRAFLKKKFEGFRDTARGQLKNMFPELQSHKRSQRVKARVKDGDTIAVDIRLLGTDAFEVKQQCQKPDGTCTPCGQGARQFMGQLFEGVEGKKGRDGLKVSFTGETTFGRPVATATIDGNDVGETLIRQGWAIAEPKYLAGDPDRLRRYTSAEAEARQAKRGAFAFQFNTPEEHRRGRRLQCEYAGRASR
jgi:endonuclease YncB( thermonuclease family)